MPNRPLRARDLTDDKILVYSNKKPEVMLFFGIVHLRQMAQVSEEGIIRRGIQPSEGDMLMHEIKESNLNEEEKKIEYAKIIIKYANILAAAGGSSRERTSGVTGGYSRTRRVTSSKKGPSGRKRSKKIKRSRSRKTRRSRRSRRSRR